MTPQLIGAKACKATRKAERFLKERGIPFQFVDIQVKIPGRRELELFAATLESAADLIDTTSKTYRSRSMEYLDFDPITEILENPDLLKTPVIRTDKGIAVAPSEARLRELSEQERR